MPTLAILDPVVAALSTILGVEPAASRPGAQHRIDREYFQRIQAMEFALTHDDGQLAAQAEDADVVLVGVSRTSKTPTAMYLANRGVRVANIPVVPGIELPRWIEDGTGTALIVALTTSPDRLSVLRRARLSSIGVGADAEYSDRVRIRDEVVEANRMYARMGWPTIDVTGRSSRGKHRSSGLSCELSAAIERGQELEVGEDAVDEGFVRSKRSLPVIIGWPIGHSLSPRSRLYNPFVLDSAKYRLITWHG